MQGPALAQAGGTSTPPENWETEIDKLIAAPDLSKLTVPPWVWQMIIQALQMLLQNILKPKPTPSPTLVGGKGN